MKVITSKLTTPQLEALAKQVLNAQDQRHVSYLMRSPEYFRRDIIQFITAKAGREPDQIVEGMAAAQLRRETAAEQQTQSDGGGTVLKYIDLSKQGQSTPQGPNTLVAVGCGGCGIRLSITLAELQEHGGAYCPKCITGAAKEIEKLESAFAEFVQTVGTAFYPIQSNIDAMLAEINRRKITVPTADNFLDVFLALQSQLLGRLTEEDVRNMKSWEYEARLRIDPGMGGVDLENHREGRPRGEASIHSSNKAKTYDLGALGISSQAGRS